MRGLLLLILPWMCSSDGSPTGRPDCPCIEWANLNQDQVGSVIHYTPKGQTTVYEYPLNYGNLECKAHDSGLAPFCDGASAPAWCGQKWCYVDKTSCTGVVPYRSALFDNSNVYYSYKTCGSSNQFNEWTTTLNEGSKTPDSVTEMLDVIQTYLWSTRARIEAEHSALASASCTFTNQCPCLECVRSNLWNRNVDFKEVGVNAKDAVFGCLARPVSQSYVNIAAKEADPEERVGYIYFSDHKSGSYLGWPAVDWCPDSSYDPRFRPWYSSGSTGPKDLVIVVDVSGSMYSNGRADLAKAATKAVIDTLEWKDYATIILFNDGIAAQYSNNLVPMFDAERINAKNWLENQIWAQGGTNFRTSLNTAFDVISSSVRAGTTSMCEKAILFLTDGEADFSEADYERIKGYSTEMSVALFTYALGSGADTTVTRRLACENKGIFYPLADGADLSRAMSKYYEYFASGVELCTPSFTKYQDVVTGAELWPACLPSYDRSSGERGLLGVGCMDLNVMIDMQSLQNQAYYSNFVCKISDLTKQCIQLDMTDCRLEKLRAAVSASSTCQSVKICLSTSQPDTCPCADPSCQDNEDFLDELNYFCDTWVGDDCTKATEWGYSSAGQQAVLQNCKRSCGQCPLVAVCPQQGQCQTKSISSKPCRSARTNRVTPNTIDAVGTQGASASTRPMWLCFNIFGWILFMIF